MCIYIYIMYNKHSFIKFTIVQALNIEYYEIYITLYVCIYNNLFENCHSKRDLSYFVQALLSHIVSRNQDDD